MGGRRPLQLSDSARHQLASHAELPAGAGGASGTFRIRSPGSSGGGGGSGISSTRSPAPPVMAVLPAAAVLPGEEVPSVRRQRLAACRRDSPRVGGRQQQGLCVERPAAQERVSARLGPRQRCAGFAAGSGFLQALNPGFQGGQVPAQGFVAQTQQAQLGIHSPVGTEIEIGRCLLQGGGQI